MILGIFLCSFIATSFLWAVYWDEIDDALKARRKRREVARAREDQEIKQVVQKITSVDYLDQDHIKRLEADIFGEGLAIDSLPGYTWQVQLNGFHDIFVRLCNVENKHVAAVTIGSRSSVDGYPRGERTEEELEEEMQKAMRKMVSDEAARQRISMGRLRLIEKYNGSSVVQDV